VINPSQRPLPTQDNTTYKRKGQTSMPSAGGGIRTRDLSNQAAADLRLRPRGHRDRLRHIIQVLNLKACDDDVLLK
jgi:hypothetical protein